MSRTHEIRITVEGGRVHVFQNGRQILDIAGGYAGVVAGDAVKAFVDRALGEPEGPRWTEEGGQQFDLARQALNNEIEHRREAARVSDHTDERDRLRRDVTALTHLRMTLSPGHPACGAIIRREFDAILAERQAVDVADLDDDLLRVLADDDFDPMDDPEYREFVEAYAERRRAERAIRPAVELAELLLGSAGLSRDIAEPLLERAESVEDVLYALRGVVRVVRAHEESYASEELKRLAEDLIRQRFANADVRQTIFQARKSGTAGIVVGLRRMLIESAQDQDGLFPGRPPLPAGDVRYPVEDGPGSGDTQRLEVLVMRGTRRSTVAVIEDGSGRQVHRDVYAHAEEATAAGRAVERAIREGRRKK